MGEGGYEGEDAINELTGRIIGGAMAVHRELGPGLLERTYQACLAAELAHAGLHIDLQVPVRVIYRNVDLQCGYRLDMVVERTVVVELKVATSLLPVFTSQVLTYLRLSGLQVGLLINFNVDVLITGVRRIVWGRTVKLPSSRGQ